MDTVIIIQADTSGLKDQHTKNEKLLLITENHHAGLNLFIYFIAWILSAVSWHDL
jgi:hypothetical protein